MNFFFLSRSLSLDYFTLCGIIKAIHKYCDFVSMSNYQIIEIKTIIVVDFENRLVQWLTNRQFMLHFFGFAGDAREFNGNSSLMIGVNWSFSLLLLGFQERKTMFNSFNLPPYFNWTETSSRKNLFRNLINQHSNRSTFLFCFVFLCEVTNAHAHFTHSLALPSLNVWSSS